MAGRSNKVVGQIGEFLACAEIARHCDCITTPFAGNVPVFDALATDERCRAIPLQIKTVNGGDWQFDATRFLEINLDEDNELQSIAGLCELDHPNLIHVFVWLGHRKREPDRFFLCTCAELQGIIHDNYGAWLKKHDGRRPRNWKTTHCAVRTTDLTAYENRWDLVTARLQEDAPAV